MLIFQDLFLSILVTESQACLTPIPQTVNSISVNTYTTNTLSQFTAVSSVMFVSRDAFASFALATIQLFAGADR